MTEIDLLLQNALLLILLAVLTEAVTEGIKAGFPNVEHPNQVMFFLSMTVGIILAFAFNINLFNLEGFGYYATLVTTGIIVSRGSNYIHDFLKNVSSTKS